MVKGQIFKLPRGITIQFKALTLIDFHNSHVLRPSGDDNANIQKKTVIMEKEIESNPIEKK